jgi:hypothetical protein
MLVDLGQKGELVLSIASYPAIALENTLNSCIEKYVYVDFDHRYNVFPIHLHTLLGLGNLKKVVSVCAERL